MSTTISTPTQARAPGLLGALAAVEPVARPQARDFAALLFPQSTPPPEDLSAAPTDTAPLLTLSDLDSVEASIEDVGEDVGEGEGEGEDIEDETALFALALGAQATPVELFPALPLSAPTPPAHTAAQADAVGTPAPTEGADEDADAEAASDPELDLELPTLPPGVGPGAEHRARLAADRLELQPLPEVDGHTLPEGLEALELDLPPIEAPASAGLSMLAEPDPTVVVHASSLDRLSLRVSDGPDQVLDIEVEKVGEDGLEVRVVAPPEEVESLRELQGELERTLEERGLRLGRYAAEARQESSSGRHDAQHGAGGGPHGDGGDGAGGEGEGVEGMRPRGLGRLLNIQA